MKDELSPRARALVESHRRSKVLSRADRERMKRDLMLRVATLGATATTTGTALGMSLASKVALVALGLSGLVAGGVIALRAGRERAPSAMLAPAQSAPLMAGPIVAPESVATSTTPVVPPDVEPQENSRREPAKKLGEPVAARANRTPAAAAAVPFDPEPELRVLREAREDLRAGRPESAYRRLDEYGRQNGVGMLSQERKALSVIALCRWQPGTEAQARASEFLRNSPDSPLARRVHSACEKTGKSPE